MAADIVGKPGDTDRLHSISTGADEVDRHVTDPNVDVLAVKQNDEPNEG